MSETLLDMANTQYRIAKVLYKSIGEDEAFINAIGYHLQQSAELAIKHLLETSAVKYPKTHDIGELLGMLPDNFDTSLLTPISGLLTSWEAKTRYIKDYRLSVRQIDAGLKDVGEFLKYAANPDDDIISKYISDDEREDFLKSVPSSTEITVRNIEVLANMYHSLKEKW